MSEIGLYRTCRICLRDSCYFTDIYKHQFGEEYPFFEVVNDVCQLDVEVDDGLPEFLCCACFVKITEFEAFKRTAHESKAAFQCLLNERRKQGTLCAEEEFLLENKCDDAYVPVNTEIFLSDMKMEGDDNYSLDEVDPLEVNEETDMEYEELNIKKEMDERLVVPMNEDETSRLRQQHAASSNDSEHTEQSIRIVKLTVVSNLPVIGPNHGKNTDLGSNKPLTADASFSLNSRFVTTDPVCKNRLQANLSGHSQGSLFRCNMCNAMFPQKVQIERHLLTHKRQAFVCDQCNLIFTEGLTLECHKKVVHSGSDHCEPIPKRQKVAIDCVDKEKRMQFSQLGCKICRKTFASKSNLTVHMISHAADKLFHCNVCRQKCHNRERLAWHKENFHPNSI